MDVRGALYGFGSNAAPCLKRKAHRHGRVWRRMADGRNAKHKSRGLMLIAVFKLIKGLSLLALGFGELHYLHRDLAHEVAHWIDLLRVDPHNHYITWLVEKISKVDPQKLRELSVGTFFYAALFLCEGTGLALRKRWAEYMTIISTSSLLPIEVYEIFVRPSWARVLILVVNIAIVVYLIRELKRPHAKTR
jgi:uncharacterized membrane protein (DUF2068 family)